MASTDALVAQASVMAAHAMARAVVVAVDESQSNDRPLTQLQIIDLVASALVCFDGFQEEAKQTFKTITMLENMTGGS